MTIVELDSPAEIDEPTLDGPPRALQAEEAVISSVLKHGPSIGRVAAWLKPGDFYDTRNRHDYAAMLALFNRGEPIDYHTVLGELERQGTLEAAGGLSRLSEIRLDTPIASHVVHYGEAVLDRSVRRRYISACQRGAELAWDVRQPLESVKSQIEAAVLGASCGTLGKKVLFNPEEWTQHAIEYLSQGQSNGLAGLSTGLADLDAMTLGLCRGWLYLLGARPGTGKTALAGQIALHVGENHGPVAFISMELSDVDLAVRFIASLTGVPKERIVTGRLSDAEATMVLEAAQWLEKSRVHIAFGGTFTSSDVRAFALQVQADERMAPALIVVDYLQLLRDQEGDGRSRERNVGLAARSLKGLAQELQVPVLACAQFNRDLVGRAEKRPSLTDLRDSGDLENTADSVLALYRDEIVHPDSSQRGLAELSVLKKRQLGAEVGTVRQFVWAGERYQDYAGR